MDYFAALQAFVSTVERGSFSRAAAARGIKVSTVSRYVAALEADLGAALLNRSTRQLHPTEIGSSLYARAAGILADLDEARASARSFNQRPQGLLRLNLPPAFARRQVVPQLAHFLALHPEIRLELTLSEATVDLIEAGSDLAIRIGVLSSSTLIARRLAPHRHILVAQPAWLSRSKLAAPDDLAAVDCLTAVPKEIWRFRADALDTRSVSIQGRLATSDIEARHAAAIAGLGAAVLPTWLAAEALRDGRLAPLLPDWRCSPTSGPEASIWAIYPPKKVVAPKVRVFLNFLTSRLGPDIKPEAAHPASGAPDCALSPSSLA